MYSDYPVFQVGNTRIITMENFEALGRYITAKEQAEAFAAERNKLLKSAISHLERAATGYSGMILAYDFDPAAVMEIIEKAADVHKNLMMAVDEGNRQADLCGKHKLKIEKPYHY